MKIDIVVKKQLNILIQLAEADKHFAKEEREMIFRIAQAHHFPEEQISELICNPEPIDTLGALSLDQKFNYLHACLELIYLDQKISESEIIFCKGIAIKLGFKKKVIDFLLENFNTMPLSELKSTVLNEYL